MASSPQISFFPLTACAICGVLCISLPIPIIVNNFNKFYEKAKIEEEIEVKRKKASWEEAKKGEIGGVIYKKIPNESAMSLLFRSSRRSQKILHYR